MSALAHKLRALRRQAGVAGAQPLPELPAALDSTARSAAVDTSSTFAATPVLGPPLPPAHAASAPAGGPAATESLATPNRTGEPAVAVPVARRAVPPFLREERPPQAPTTTPATASRDDAATARVRALLGRRLPSTTTARPATTAAPSSEPLPWPLQRATAKSTPPTSGGPAVSAPSASALALRRLRSLRHPPAPRTPTDGAVPLPTSSHDPRHRQPPGEPIAEGLYYREILAEWPAPPDTIDTRFARLDASVPAGRLLHFDTETTGLAGGTGTRAFMIGAADWHQGHFRIRQLTIGSLAAEAAMLAEFSRWLTADTVLVSYNGKSYDAPLLATRYRLARLRNPLTGLQHLDLLHPVRRQWRSQWPNCRLATAERELLQVVREDDLPGSEAPAAWLAYLRGGSAHTLHRVAEHNAQDLRSLAGVLLKMAQTQAP